MECRKMFIFICVIVCISSIAGVCASDMNETVVADGDFNQTQSSDTLSISSDDGNDVLDLDDNDEKLSGNDSNIIASDLATSYQKDDYLVVTLKDNDGHAISGVNLTVSLNGIYRYITDSNGQIKVSTKHLNATTYDANINFAGNQNHSGAAKTVKITVDKIDSILSINGNYTLNYGSSINITAGIIGASAILANISGRPVNVNGKQIVLPKLNAGTYVLSVTTVPDANHNSVTRNVTITVNKIDSVLDITDMNLNYGGSVSVNVNMGGIKGISAEVDGKYMEFKDNKLRVTGLSAGTHIMRVTTIPDENHNPVSKNVTVTVNKVNSSITLNDLDLTYGSSFDMAVGAKGATKLIAKIDGNDVEVNGNLISIPLLDVGTHTMTVTSIPDDNHYAVTATVNVNVAKVKSQVMASSYNATVGQKINLKVMITSIHTINDGVVTFFDGETKIGQSDVKGGVATLFYTPSKPGNYSISVVYNGTSKYMSSNSIIKLNVLENSSGYNSTDLNGKLIVVIPSFDGNSSVLSVEVIMPSNATGNVTLTVNNTDYVLKLSNGVAKVILPDFDGDDCLYTVTYSGDDNYAPFTDYGSFKVNRTGASQGNNSGGFNPKIVVPSLDGLSCGDSVEIKFPADATGTVTLTVDGSDYIFNVANGVCIVELPDLNNCIYQYAIAYSGDAKYLSCNVNGSLKVNRTSLNPVDNSTAGNSSQSDGKIAVVVPSLDGLSGGDSFEIKFPADATGAVTLTANNRNYVFYVNGGVCSIVLPDLNNGVYLYSIAYSGDAKYSSFVTNGTFKVNGTDSNPIANETGNKTNSTENGSEITVPSLDGFSAGDTVEIKFPDDASGTVLLTIDNNGYVFNVANGVCKVRLPDLADGEYSYTIKYSGDGKYPSFTNRGSFTANKTGTTSIGNATGNKTNYTQRGIEVVAPSLDGLSGDSFVIELPADASGSITLSINNRDYVFKVVNGVCNVKLPNNLANGNYQYKLTYSGDGKYSSFENKGSLKVNHAGSSKVTVSDCKVTYGTGSYYKLTIYGANGKVAKGVDVVIKINGKKLDTFKTDSNGIVKFKVTQKPGTYNVQANALGISISGKLIVKHLVSLKKVTVKKSAKKLVLTATLGKVNKKYLKNKKIIFKFNGKTYNSKTNSKRVAKVTIKSSVLKKLKVGKKVTYQATYLKDTVKYTVKVKK